LDFLFVETNKQTNKPTKNKKQSTQTNIEIFLCV